MDVGKDVIERGLLCRLPDLARLVDRAVFPEQQGLFLLRVICQLFQLLELRAAIEALQLLLELEQTRGVVPDLLPNATHQVIAHDLPGSLTELDAEMLANWVK